MFPGASGGHVAGPMAGIGATPSTTGGTGSAQDCPPSRPSDGVYCSTASIGLTCAYADSDCLCLAPPDRGGGVWICGEGVRGTGVGDWEVCVEASVEVATAPEMLQFVIDTSSSMNEAVASTGERTKWEATVEALSSLYGSINADFAVGQSYFPTVLFESDDAAACLDREGGVPIALLGADQVSALEQDLRAQPTPAGFPGTVYEAWREGLRRLQERLADPPPGYEQSAGVIVLLSDGLPTYAIECNGAAGQGALHWAFLEDTALAAAVGIRTLVVGLPGSNVDRTLSDGLADQLWQGDVPVGALFETETDPSLDKLSTLAVAGRTAQQPCPVEDNSWCHIDLVTATDLVSALRTRLEDALLGPPVICQYPLLDFGIPMAFINPDDLELYYYRAGTDAPVELSRSDDGCVHGEWALAEDGSSWMLCSSACAAIRADERARIEMSFGCIVPM